MKYFSLFSGIGGFEYVVKQLARDDCPGEKKDLTSPAGYVKIRVERNQDEN